MKSIISLFAACAIGAAAFASPVWAQDKGTVGIAMPTKSSARWIDDGNNIVKQLQDAGWLHGRYRVGAAPQPAEL